MILLLLVIGGNIGFCAKEPSAKSEVEKMIKAACENNSQGVIDFFLNEKRIKTLKTEKIKERKEYFSSKEVQEGWCKMKIISEERKDNLSTVTIKENAYFAIALKFEKFDNQYYLTDLTSNDDDIKVYSFSEIHTMYRDNELKADADLKGKTIQVTGTIYEIGKTISGEPEIILGGEQFSLEFVRCNILKESIQTATTLKKGEQVLIMGKTKGLVLKTIFLNDCLLFPWKK